MICADEKTCIQALGRREQTVPPSRGHGTLADNEWRFTKEDLLRRLSDAVDEIREAVRVTEQRMEALGWLAGADVCSLSLGFVRSSVILIPAGRADPVASVSPTKGEDNTVFKRTARLGAALLSLAVLLIAGCSGPAKPAAPAAGSTTPAPTPAQPQAPAAKKDLKLTIYGGMQEAHVAKAAKAFAEETGIKTDFIRMSGGEILTRIRAEKANPQASIWYGGPADTFIQAKGEGLLEPYKSTAAARIDAKFKDTDGVWSGIYVGSLGFATNKKFLQEKKIDPPKSWKDLLKPEFKGQVVMADPGSSGTAFTTVATILQLMGEGEGWKYLKALAGQVQQFTKSGSAPGQMAARGEIGVGILFSHDIIQLQKEGYQLELTFPGEGTGYEIGSVAIIKGGPDQEAARKFVDWALGKKAQEIGQTVGSYQLLTNPEAQSPSESIPLSQLKVVNYDLDWAGKNRKAILERWNKEITK